MSFAASKYLLVLFMAYQCQGKAVAVDMPAQAIRGTFYIYQDHLSVTNTSRSLCIGNSSCQPDLLPPYICSFHTHGQHKLPEVSD